MLLAALLAATGCAGAVALSEVGTVFYDNVTSLGVFGSLLLLIKRWPHLCEGRLASAVLAGLPVGLIFGLKQSMAPFPIGLGIALLLTLPVGWRGKIRVTAGFGLGMAIAMIAGGGFWMFHLWHSYGNPLFPYFNQIFHSPWGRIDDYRDVNFQPQGFAAVAVSARFRPRRKIGRRGRLPGFPLAGAVPSGACRIGGRRACAGPGPPFC